MNNTSSVKEERTKLSVRLRLKYTSPKFWGNLLWGLLKYVLLIGISFIIIYPFFSKLSASFMSDADFVDKTVTLIPKQPTLDRYRIVIAETNYWTVLLRTVLMCVGVGVLEMLMCTMVGYGFAKFKFKGNNLLFLLVVFMMIIPPQTYTTSLYMHFRYFDLAGLVELIAGKPMNMIDTPWPIMLMSATCVYFKNGLYIFVMRQYFKGVPDELEEAAYVDGAGVFETFIRIIIPMSFGMMITIFMFGFSWQWTDTLYSGLFLSKQVVISKIPYMPKGIYQSGGMSSSYSAQAIISAGTMLVVAPLVLLYAFGQKALIGGIERSGLVG